MFRRFCFDSYQTAKQTAKHVGRLTSLNEFLTIGAAENARDFEAEWKWISDWNATGSNLQLDLESHQYLISVLLLILLFVFNAVASFCQKPFEWGRGMRGVLGDVRSKKALAYE